MHTSRRRFLGALAAAGLVAEAAGRRPAQAAPIAAGQFSRFDFLAKPVLAKMTLDEKIGQMLQAEQSELKSLDDIETYHLGSLFSGGDSDPAAGNGLVAWTDLYDRLQARALKTRLGIPILFGIDAVHGHNNVLGATIFPHNIGLGCTRNAALVEKAGRVTAEEVKATGIHWAFAPCVTVPQDIRWGRTYEGFSERPDVVRTLGGAATKGLQTGNLKDPLSVLACAKHFAGDGGTVYGTGTSKMPDSNERYPVDRGDTRADEATLKRVHLQGYVAAIEAGGGTIMPSYNSWNGVKCSASAHLLTDILKGEMGFEGFLVSDYNAIDEIPGTYKEQIAISTNAGMDMFMVPSRYAEMFTLLRDLVNENQVPLARIDDAVLRILRVKASMGLLDGKVRMTADRALHKNFGSPDHRAVARQCVRESLVVLKNDGRLLPLAKKSGPVHVCGALADDIGSQCGGWTISWQGTTGKVIEGTTILAGVRASVDPSTVVSYSADGSGADGAAVAIAVVGEQPYAEMKGDRTQLSLRPEDAALVASLKAKSIPTVVIVVSGRPLPMDETISRANAVVAAWLPGTEGGGVADVLFGVAKPTGRLSFSWPSDKSTSFRIDDPGYVPRFAFGQGLTW